MIPPLDIMRTKEEVEKVEAEAANKQPPEDPKITIAKMQIESAQKIEQMREQAAATEMQFRERIAQLEYQGKLLGLQAQTGLSQAEIETRAGIERDKTQSKERMHAVDIAVESQRAAEARAEGRPAEAAVGEGVG
jgi:hypothetical protein